MAEIPLDSQRQMAAQQDRLTIPAYYDNLTWYERRLVREEYIVLQKGLCWACAQTLLHDVPDEVKERFPLDPRRWGPEFLKHPVHLHHDHRSGLTVGATHAYCNAILAQYYGE
jgi:hypothetical protein